MNYLTTSSRPSMGIGTGIGMNAYVGYPSGVGACCSSCASGGSCGGLGEAIDFKQLGMAVLLIGAAVMLVPWALRSPKKR